MPDALTFDALIRRVRRGDQDAAAELVRTHEPAIRRAVRSRLTNERPGILLDRESKRAMVTDFGIARAMQEGADSRLTATGMAIGTPAFMSPEQGLDNPHSPDMLEGLAQVSPGRVLLFQPSRPTGEPRGPSWGRRCWRSEGHPPGSATAPHGESSSASAP